MKRNVLVLALMLGTVASTRAQYFSGEIMYKTTIIPKEGVELDPFAREQDGRVHRYLITNKQYQNTYYIDGEVRYSYTYDNDTRRMYDYTRGTPYITYRDSRIANTEYYGSLIHRDSSKQVLDYECFVVESESDFRKSFTYYSDELKIDYESFDGHLVGNWYQRLKEVDGCISLGSVTENEDHFSNIEVIEVNKRKVKAKEFKLPDLPIVASYSVLTKQPQLQKPSPDAIQCYQDKLEEGEEIEGRMESYTSYVKFLITSEGEIKHVSSLSKDEFGLNVIAIEIMKECGLSFSAGELNGVKVDSETYFPVEFKL